MNALEKICTDKREHIIRQKREVPLSALEAKIRETETPRGFLKSLQSKENTGHFALIAELKKASPSRGLIRQDFAPAPLAKAYMAGGAACLSVLTDIPYFQGNDDYLQVAREAVNLPLLRKDFMLDAYQIAESRALGADAILLIIAALDIAQAKELEAAAIEYGMDVLVEIHDQKECETALKHLKTRLVGVNNRDLKSLEVNLSTAKTLAEIIPSSHLKVCESGLFTNADLRAMQSHGYKSFLVGESLMRHEDVKKATRELLGLES